MLIKDLLTLSDYMQIHVYYRYAKTHRIQSLWVFWMYAWISTFTLHLNQWYNYDRLSVHHRSRRGYLSSFSGS